MAVPKKKTSPSRRGLRRGGNGTYRTNMPNVVVNKETGEFQLQHHISLDGHYNGKKVIKDKVKKTSEETEQND
ncbi:MAG: 50S ribosomal protein L32 [Rickettsiales bacterium]|nr:50S ribosomal protein L32 [Rickettsiales bacterium]